MTRIHMHMTYNANAL